MGNLFIGSSDDKAYKMKQGYIGVNNLAKPIKNIWVGDENNKAKLVWSAVHFDPYMCYIYGNSSNYYSYILKEDDSNYGNRNDIKSTDKSGYDIHIVSNSGEYIVTSSQSGGFIIFKRTENEIIKYKTLSSDVQNLPYTYNYIQKIFYLSDNATTLYAVCTGSESNNTSKVGTAVFNVSIYIAKINIIDNMLVCEKTFEITSHNCTYADTALRYSKADISITKDGSKIIIGTLFYVGSNSDLSDSSSNFSEVYYLTGNLKTLNYTSECIMLENWSLSTIPLCHVSISPNGKYILYNSYEVSYDGSSMSIDGDMYISKINTDGTFTNVYKDNHETYSHAYVSNNGIATYVTEYGTTIVYYIETKKRYGYSYDKLYINGTSVYPNEKTCECYYNDKTKQIYIITDKSRILYINENQIVNSSDSCLYYEGYNYANCNNVYFYNKC